MKNKYPKFYCQKVCGDEEFSIEEWNKAFEYCEKAGITGTERDKILNPELFPCENQCDDCINIVLDTQKKNKEKYAELANNEPQI